MSGLKPWVREIIGMAVVGLFLLICYVVLVFGLRVSEPIVLGMIVFYGWAVAVGGVRTLLGGGRWVDAVCSGVAIAPMFFRDRLVGWLSAVTS
jgi:hypothetical protein